MQTEPKMQQNFGANNKGGATPSGDARVLELNRIADQAEELLKSLGDTGGEAVAAVRTRVKHTLHEAREKIADQSAKARDTAVRAAHYADDYVQSNPWRSVALGALAGAVATLLIAGALRR
ncbi:MAG: DUF883 domain-containing protein [Pseudomonadales bacterium]|nr:DUF883 domain-containing protein [Pseudomonadales bacterium]